MALFRLAAAFRGATPHQLRRRHVRDKVLQWIHAYAHSKIRTKQEKNESLQELVYGC
jgi:hypothetical protein